MFDFSCLPFTPLRFASWIYRSWTSVLISGLSNVVLSDIAALLDYLISCQNHPVLCSAWDIQYLREYSILWRLLALCGISWALMGDNISILEGVQCFGGILSVLWGRNHQFCEGNPQIVQRFTQNVLMISPKSTGDLLQYWWYLSIVMMVPFAVLKNFTVLSTLHSTTQTIPKSEHTIDNI